jgi:RNA polymerase sigma factor (sigma-70 family)
MIEPIGDLVRKTVAFERLGCRIRVAMGSIEPAQLSSWFDEYAPALVLFARQWLTDGCAEDVVQEVFARLMRERSAPAHVKAWLFRSVRNEAVDQFRHRRRRESGIQEEAAGRSAWFEEQPGTAMASAEVQEALHQVPQEQREVIVLRIWCDMTLQEIAAILDQPLSTVFSRYKAGLAAVRERLESPCKKSTS